jgi:hypothetical protein
MQRLEAIVCIGGAGEENDEARVADRGRVDHRIASLQESRGREEEKASAKRPNGRARRA